MNKICFVFIVFTVFGVKGQVNSSLPKGVFVVDNSGKTAVAKVPEGNYLLKLKMAEKGLIALKVENRRLVYSNVLYKNKSKKFQVAISVRSPLISGEDSINLKSREYTYPQWDDQLSVEAFGSKIKKIGLTPLNEPTMVFLAGNSTVVDQAKEPYASWGQMIPAFFDQSVCIANYAESGESIASFDHERRLRKILSQMKTGDYLFIEFAHNDQKIKNFEPFGAYTDYLKKYAFLTREKGGIPVFVTSMHRRKFDDKGHIINTLGDFPEAMRKAATELNVPLIDLNKSSKVLWEILGVEGSKNAFIHVPEGQDYGPIEDNTHFSNYGAFLLANEIAHLLKEKLPELGKHLYELPSFRADNPLPFNVFNFPNSSDVDFTKPYGN